MTKLTPYVRSTNDPRFERLMARLAILVICGPLTWQIIQTGLPFSLDAPNHMMRLAYFFEQLRLGTSLPRWSPDLVFGLGYPLFDYYAPLGYYLGSCVMALGLESAAAFRVLLVGISLLAGLGMFQFALEFLRSGDKGRDPLGPAILAATAYVYAPYFVINLYVRVALAELLAMAILPWVLWAFRGLVSDAQPERVWPWAILTLVALVFAHSITLLIAPTVLGAYLLVLLSAQPRRWRWVATALISAAGLTIGFWLPLAAERGFVSSGSMSISREWLDLNFLRGADVLSNTWPYLYRLNSPFQLSVFQVGFGVAGFLMLRSKTREAGYLAMIALAAWTLQWELVRPLWHTADIWTIIQFPWRLNMIASLPLALFTGAIGQRLASRSWVALATSGLTLWIVLGNLPAVPFVGFFRESQTHLGAANIALYESATTQIGLSANVRNVNSDFIPRWVDLSLGVFATPSAALADTTQPDEVRVLEAGAGAVTFDVVALTPVRIRSATYYFPGWTAADGAGAPLPVSAEPGSGWLAVDVPAGATRVRLAYTGTTTQHVAGWIAVLAAGILLGLALRRRAPFGWRVMPLALAAGLMWQMIALTPPTASVTSPTEPVQGHGLKPLGFQANQVQDDLKLTVFWYVSAPAPDLEFSWQLVDDAAQVVLESHTRPWYDVGRTDSWLPNAVIDDQQQLALPPGLSAGNYRLRVCAHPVSDGTTTPVCEALQDLGSLYLQGTRAPEPVAQVLATYDDHLNLERVVFSTSSGPQASSAGRLVINAGQRLWADLTWRALQPLGADELHAFVQLVDPHGQRVASLDDSLGPFFFPQRLWGLNRPYQDTYELQLPVDLASGLYTPIVGVYTSPDDPKRLPMSGSGQSGDAFRLEPIKVLRVEAGRPGSDRSDTFGAFARLIGYDLEMGNLTPGAAITLRLYYRALQPIDRDLAQFVHLFDPELGLVAQSDHRPADGLNPTNAWLPGEVIVETVSMTIRADALPGTYNLLVGMYDPTDGQRVSAKDARGAIWPADAVVLTPVTLSP